MIGKIKKSYLIGCSKIRVIRKQYLSMPRTRGTEPNTPLNWLQFVYFSGTQCAKNAQ